MFQNALHSKSKLFVNKKQCAKLSVYLIRRKLFQKIINTRACRIATVTAIYNHGIISWYNKPFSGFCFSENCLWSPSFSEKLTRSADSSVSIHYLTRIAERRFLTWLQRDYFFWREGAAIYTQATITPCRQPLDATEPHVRLKHKLIQNIVPFWKTFVTKKKSTIFEWGLYNNF